MKKYLIFLFTFAFHVQVIAKDIYCQFEEVYQNGETQQGQLLSADGKLRYEYFDQNLFTLLFANKNLFQIENVSPHRVEKVDNTQMIEDLFLIYSKYPEINQSYKKNDYEILIEKHSSLFIKRMAIKSKRINLSIYFLHCEKKIIDKQFFNFNPFVSYVPS